LIEQAEALGEPPEDPLLLFSVLYGFWVGNLVAFDGDATRELAAQFLALAEKQQATLPLVVGHRLMGSSLLHTGDFAEGRGHYNQSIALYNPAVHQSQAIRFGQDARVTALSFRQWTLWMLGYPEAALADAERALRDARAIGQAATLMLALTYSGTTHFFCGNHPAAMAQCAELTALADENNSPFWKAHGTMAQGRVFAATGRVADGIQTLTTGITTYRSTRGTLYVPSYLSHLAAAYAELGQFNDAWSCVREATTLIKASKENWHAADLERTCGEIALISPQPDAAKAQVHFQRSLGIARQQQAKSWELRAAMSLARLWRSQGKSQQARELLAPVYGWFTEGHDTRDLKDAKVLLEELQS
jgi:predicted ATPase